MTFNPDSLPAVEYDEDDRAIPVMDAERKLLAGVKTGEYVEISTGLDVSDADAWEEHQVIRADFLRHLCLKPKLYNIDPRGVRFVGALIAGELNLDSATLERPLWVVDSRFTTELVLLDATTRSLILQGCHLRGVMADRLHVTGAMMLRGSTLTGTTSLLGAYISGSLECDKATFENSNGNAFMGHRLRVKGGFFWRNLKTPPLGHVYLGQAQVGDFVDDGSGWPEAGKLWVDGFQYESLPLPTSAAAERKKWLALMPKTLDGTPVFWPQPYEQLIKVFRAAGHERDAREIAIAKQDAYAAYLKLKEDAGLGSTWNRRLGLWLLKAIAGYGYAPWKTLKYAAVFIWLGSVLFFAADAEGRMVPAKEKIYLEDAYKTAKENGGTWLQDEYPELNSFYYALDTFVPFVDLHQETYWEPKADGVGGGFLRGYLWVHIIAGWVLTTFAVAGFTGLIKKD